MSIEVNQKVIVNVNVDVEKKEVSFGTLKKNEYFCTVKLPKENVI